MVFNIHNPIFLFIPFNLFLVAIPNVIILLAQMNMELKLN